MSRYEFTADWFTGQAKQWPELLCNFIGRPRLQFVEVGSHEGRSAVWMLENVLTDPSSRLTCIDVWKSPEAELRFDWNITASGRAEQVRKIKQPSCEALPKLPHSSVDFVYVDGSHEGRDVLMDGLLALRILKPGGLLLFDDYEWKGSENANRHHLPKPGIDAFLELNDFEIEEVYRGYQLAVRKR